MKKINFFPNKFVSWYIFLIASIVIMLGGFLFYKYSVTNFISEQQIIIKEDCEKKVRQITLWHEEIQKNNSIISKNQNIITSIKEYIFSNPSKKQKNRIEKNLRFYAETYKFSNILFISTNKTIKFSAFENKETGICVPNIFIKQTQIHKAPISTGFYCCANHKNLHFDIISNLYDQDSTLLGQLICRSTPKEIMQTVFRDFNTHEKTEKSIVFNGRKPYYWKYSLNKYGIIESHEIKITEANKNSIEVLALSSLSMSINGEDKFGIELFGYVSEIPNTSWKLIATRNTQSTIEATKYISVFVTLIAFLLIIIVIIIMNTLSNLSQKKLYQGLYKKELEVQESNLYFKTVLFSIVDCVIITDKNGKIIKFNKNAEDLSLWKAEEIIGKDLVSVFVIKNKIKNAIEKDLLTKIRQGIITEGLPIDYSFINKNNLEIPISFKASNITSKNGNEFQGYVVIFENQTQQFQAQQKLEKSEEEYRMLFSDMNMGFAVHEIITDLENSIVDFRFLNVNPVFQELTGLKADRIIGKKMTEIFQNSSKVWIEAYKKIEKNHEAVEFEIERNSENRIYKVTGFRSFTGLFAVSLDDITQQHANISALKLSKLKAEESDRLKTAFLNNISHEIRTPLNAITGFANFLTDPSISESKRNEFVDIIQKSSNQLISIITDIINISKLDAQQEQVYTNKIDLIDLMHSLQIQLSPYATKKGIQLHLELPIQFSELTILSDQTKLIQVLTNLIMNAIKFTKRGYVKFGFIKLKTKLSFFVEDTGIGIQQEKHNEIFMRFRQASNTIASEYGGTGLGLSISKSYIEMMGGKIWLKSIPNQGSQFYFEIPFNEIENIELGQNKKTSLPMKNTDLKKTVLIAEDENFNYLLFEEYLKDFNFNIIHAENGQIAINEFQKNPKIDLILMDIKMPIIDGYEATKIIKQLNPNVPVIALTAYALAGDMEKAIENQCDAYLAKPIKKKDLIELIIKYL